MLVKLVIPKYFDPGSLVVNVLINGQSIKNALIDLAVAINVMTKDTMKKLNIKGIRATPTILQLADISIVTPYGMIEDIVVTLDSLEYPMDFMILSLKFNLSGYPVILGQPWLATTDANISCRLGSMTISDGQATKKFDLYPPTQPQPHLSTFVWPNLGEEEEELNTIA